MAVVPKLFEGDSDNDILRKSDGRSPLTAGFHCRDVEFPWLALSSCAVLCLLGGGRSGGVALLVGVGRTRCPPAGAVVRRWRGLGVLVSVAGALLYCWTYRTEPNACHPV